ncbi:Methionyl-tRNA formyltransferase [hydrothermal vent metagenome]|uniref:methionyl-tRNA formyltransferase n=1 Tax=hydrothermal vent metagenome TaxID=652676 RepID=A0A3B0ZI38_9ZZZZ
MKPLKIIFAGTPEFAAVALHALLASEHEVCAVYTQPDRPAGRGRKLTAGPVKQTALDYAVPVYQPLTLCDADVQAELEAHEADVMVVVAYGLILPVEVLQAPRHGCINIHASLLPRWRGAAPIQRAIIAGDTESGVTIIQMDKGLDTGAMLEKRTCKITEGDSGGQLHDRLAKLGAAAVLSTLVKISDGSVSGEVQDDALSCYASKIDKKEALVDWSHPALEIRRQVSAFNPWPVAYTLLPDGQRLRIWQAVAIPADSDSVSGTVIEANKTGIDIATGDGLLRLLQVQLPGGRQVSSGDFLNAYALKSSARLDESQLT